MSATTALTPKPSPSTFRLFDPLEPEPKDDGDLTLREFFEKHHRPELEDVAQGTIDEYLNQLKHWEKRTTNPPIREVTDDTFLAIKKSLKAEKYSAASIGKMVRTLSPIFRTALRRGVIERVPRTKLPRVDLGEPRVASKGQLSRMYKSCALVKITRGPGSRLDGPSLFRAAIVFFYNVGPRYDDLWSMDWTSIDFVKATARFYVKKRHHTITRPLNAMVMAHLKLLRDASSGIGRIFPITKPTIIRWWKRIRVRAGVPTLTFQDLRRTCQTRLDEIHPLVGDWMVDHKPQGVGGLYYRNLKKKGREVSDALKQPKAFCAAPKERQKRLF